MNKKTTTVTMNGYRVSVEIRDRNSDTAWVFLHGWASRKEVWQQVAKRFSATTATVDLPGFGQSDMLKEPWNTAYYSRSINALINKLGFSSVVLVGHSFGGQVAAHVASQQPNWLKGLVLVGAAIVREQEPKALSAIGNFLSPLFRLPLLRRLRPALYQLIGADMPPKDLNLRKTMQTVLREDQTDRLSAITVPVKIIWGDEDDATPTENAKLINSQISNSSVSVLDGGHFIFIDAPKEFRDTLTTFSNELHP